MARKRIARIPRPIEALVLGAVIIFTSAASFGALAKPASPTAAAPAGEPTQAQKLPLTPLTIVTGDGRRLRFKVEVAVTPREQQTGLMFRPSMPADNGMLFTYKQPLTLGVWMENTYLPLDLVFIGVDHRIAGITANAQPLTRDVRWSPGPVIAFLELNGGRAAALKLRVGDRIEHSGLPAAQ